MGLKFASLNYSSREVEGRWSILVFLQGCNFRCKHCHNWRLVLGLEEEYLDEDTVLYEVVKNPFIDCLVISGGEPSLRKPEEVVSFIKKVKRERPEIKVRVDTNGSRPFFIRELKPFVEGFAVDVKAPPYDQELYSYTAGVPVDTGKILESLYEADGMELTIFRTVKYPWLGRLELERIRDFLSGFSSPFYLNPFAPVPSCPFNR